MVSEVGCVVIPPGAFFHGVDFLEGPLSLVPLGKANFCPMVFLVAVEALLPIGWAFLWSMLRATVFAVDDIAGGLLAV